jgi:hypothetical protein
MIALLIAAALAPQAPEYVAPDGRTETQLIAAHVLPDPASAPGEINPDVTQATINATICVHGWTATVRPPVSYTNAIKRRLLPPGHKLSEYELDHRLSIEDSGAPARPANLWMMIYADRYGARVKDVLETRLRELVCSEKISLDKARSALLGNWLSAYAEYVGELP